MFLCFLFLQFTYRVYILTVCHYIIFSYLDYVATSVLIKFLCFFVYSKDLHLRQYFLFRPY